VDIGEPTRLTRMYGPAVRASGFAELAVSGLASMYPALIGANAPGHHGYQRACVLISGQASIGPFGLPVFACAERPNLHLVSSSQTSAGNCRVTSSLAPHIAQFLCSNQGPVFGGELPVALQIEVALHVADRKMKPICRPVAATCDWKQPTRSPEVLSHACGTQYWWYRSISQSDGSKRRTNY